MARRNKKASNQTIRWEAVAGAAGVFVFLTAMGIGYVWHDQRNDVLRREIAEKTAFYERLIEQRRGLELRLAQRLAPASLRAQVERMKLGLSEPSPTQVLRVIEPPAPEPEASQPGAMLAAHEYP